MVYGSFICKAAHQIKNKNSAFLRSIAGLWLLLNVNLMKFSCWQELKQIYKINR